MDGTDIEIWKKIKNIFLHSIKWVKKSWVLVVIVLIRINFKNVNRQLT